MSKMEKVKYYAVGLITASAILASGSVVASAIKDKVTEYYDDVKIIDNSKQVILNDSNVQEVKHLSYNNTIYVPLKSTCEILGKDVQKKNNTVLIEQKLTDTAALYPDESANLSSNCDNDTNKAKPSSKPHYNCWGEDLGGKYKEIKGSLALPKDSKITSVKIDIYADDKLLKSCVLKKGVAATSIEANITGADKMSFEADVPITIDEYGECGDKNVKFEIMLDTKPSAINLGSITAQ